jgi:hypothetical protein
MARGHHRLLSGLDSDMGKNGPELGREATGPDAHALNGIGGGIVVFEKVAATFLAATGFRYPTQAESQKRGKRGTKYNAHDIPRKRPAIIRVSHG